MSSEQCAFRTDDPAAVQAFRDADAQNQAAHDALWDDVEKIGKNKGVKVASGLVGGAEQVRGLVPDDPNDPPAGWKYLKSWGCLRPRRGAAGEPAERFLRRHNQSRPAVRSILAEHGLPVYARAVRPGGGLALCTPAIFEHDGALYALYDGDPRVDPMSGRTTEVTWPQIPLSQFHAAYEAHQAGQVAP